MQKAGFVGLGIMGKPMAANLLKNGVALAAFTRSGVPDDLKQAGAISCDSPAEVAERADVIFIMVPDTPDVERVLFGEQGIADKLRAGQIANAARSIWTHRFRGVKSARKPLR
jgi:2-hydroxy-3-oxopropionate reductase